MTPIENKLETYKLLKWLLASKTMTIILSACWAVALYGHSGVYTAAIGGMAFLNAVSFCQYNHGKPWSEYYVITLFVVILTVIIILLILIGSLIIIVGHFCPTIILALVPIGIIIYCCYSKKEG
jgi:hypothetical protein